MQAWFSKFIRGRAFSILFCALGLGLMVYLTSRLGLLIEAFTSLDLRLAVFLVLAAICSYMLFYVNIPKEEKKTRKLFHVCGVVFCFLLSAVLCFLLFDVVGILFPAHDGKWYLVPLLLAFGLAGYGFVHARKLCVQTYTVPVEGGDLGCRTDVTVALLSDIHAGSYVDRGQLRKIVDAVNRVQADLVILAGDTFDQDAFGRCDMDGIKSELQRLSPKGQIYAVLGNHDPDSSHEEVRAFFKEAGVHLLIDACAETEDFLIVGRDDILGNPDRRSLAELLSNGDAGKIKLVIDHNPLGIEDGVEAGVNLILCGHTHKGQFFPATLFTRWAYGGRGFYGHCQTGKTHSIVSSGAGYFQLPIRLGTNSEIVVLHVTRP